MPIDYYRNSAIEFDRTGRIGGASLGGINLQ